MFLVVFATLAISIIALFAQVLTLQTSRINAAQVGLMQTMAAWHAAAVKIATSNPPTNTGGLAGCNLTLGTCMSGATLIAPVATYTDPITHTSPLPVGSNTNQFSFYSIAFQVGVPAATYVVTYVGATNPLTGNLLLPGGAGPFEVGYTLQSLSKQFARTAPGYLAYGSVTNSGTLTIVQKADGSGSTPPGSSYSIPPAPTIPQGSLAIISAAQ